MARAITTVTTSETATSSTDLWYIEDWSYWMWTFESSSANLQRKRPEQCDTKNKREFIERNSHFNFYLLLFDLRIRPDGLFSLLPLGFATYAQNLSGRRGNYRSVLL